MQDRGRNLWRGGIANCACPGWDNLSFLMFFLSNCSFLLSQFGQAHDPQSMNISNCFCVWKIMACSFSLVPSASSSTIQVRPRQHLFNSSSLTREWSRVIWLLQKSPVLITGGYLSRIILWAGWHPVPEVFAIVKVPGWGMAHHLSPILWLLQHGLAPEFRGHG